MNSRDYNDLVRWEKNRNSAWTNFKKSMTPVTVFAFLALFILGYWMFTTSKVNPNVSMLVMGAVVVVILMRGSKKIEKEQIPENIAKGIVESLMRRKIGIEYPHGTQIFVMDVCSTRYEGEWGQPFRPWKWEVGVLVIYPDGLRRTKLVRLHPYDGYLTKITEESAGYSGQDSKDLKVMMPYQLTTKEEKPKIG